MKLTDDQRQAVEHSGNVTLVACPGSGKTHTIVAKAARAIEDVRKTPPRLVACITYTNAAAKEVSDRLSLLAINDWEDCCEVATIHSFCLNNVLGNFHWRIPEYQSGYEVLPPDAAEYRSFASTVTRRYGLDSGVFELLRRGPDGEPIVGDADSGRAALEFWQELQQAGYIDFPNIVYYSFRLMRDHPGITKALAAKFKYFLVDEFQDTTALQVGILKLVADQGLSEFFLVGDPHQSIFRFAGARPELLDSFAEYVDAYRGCSLQENWRCGPEIIRHAEALCPREPAMRPAGQAILNVAEPVYVHARSSFDAITDYFLPALAEMEIPHGKAAILAPQWWPLLALGRKLRGYGVPIVGPGARPYRRVHAFARVAEEVAAYLEERDPGRIAEIERELFWLVSNVTGKPNFQIYSYEGRKVMWGLLVAADHLQENLSGAGAAWLTETAQVLSNILVDAELLPRSCCDLLRESAVSMIDEMRTNGEDVQNMTTADIGIFAQHGKSVRLLTMHRAKGLEFDAVAIVDLHDRKVPFRQAYEHPNLGERESIKDDGRRLLYVAITRARRFLMYATDDSKHWHEPSPFLLEGELGLTATTDEMPY